MEGGFFNFADVTDFGIEIRNVERNDFSLSGDLADVEDKSRIYYDAENRLVWIYEEVMSVGGVNVKFDTKMVFERTNEITATAKLSGSGNIHVPNMSSISYQMNGTFSGKRIASGTPGKPPPVPRSPYKPSGDSLISSNPTKESSR